MGWTTYNIETTVPITNPTDSPKNYMSYKSKNMASAVDLEIYGSGHFYKLGRNIISSWKNRTYKIAADANKAIVNLTYYHPSTSQEKGTLLISSIKLELGSRESIQEFMKSGACLSNISEDDLVSLKLTAIEDDFRVLELIFGSRVEAKSFVDSLANACVDSNIEVNNNFVILIY